MWGAAWALCSPHVESVLILGVTDNGITTLLRAYYGALRNALQMSPLEEPLLTYEIPHTLPISEAI